MKAYRLIAACLAGLLLIAGLARTASRDNAQISELFKPVVSKAAECTVAVRMRLDYVQAGPMRTQTAAEDVCLGTIVGADGWILTKFSELNGPAVCRLPDGREFDAKLVGVHREYDLALLKVEAKGLPVIEWAESKGALRGHWTATPLIGDRPLAVGIVSVAAREKKDWPPSLNPNRGYLGITFSLDVDAPSITAINPGTAAEKSGAKVGDVIVGIQGKEIKHRDQMVQAIAALKPFDVLTFKVKRKVKNGDGEEVKEIELKAALGRFPLGTDRSEIQDRMGKSPSDVRTGFPSILTHDTVLKPIECGGPVVNIDGKAIGINICCADRTATYAIPSEAILNLLPDLQAGKLPPPLGREPNSEEKDMQKK